MRTLSFQPARVALSTGSLRRSTTLSVALRVALGGLSALYIAAFVVAAAFRLSYPFPLEITESAALEQVLRILHGQPLYAAPTLEHVPLIYGPAYFYASALVTVATGPTYAALRLVSLCASLGSLWIVARFVLRETGSTLGALAAAGLLAATYPLGQTALDLGRVDALFLFLALASVYLVYWEAHRWPALLLSGGMLALAAMTKSPVAAVPLAGVLLIYLGLSHPRSVLHFVIGIALVLAAGLIALHAQDGAWATWYMWNLTSMHEVRPNLVERFWFVDVLPRFSLPLLIGPVFVLGRLLEGKRRPLLFYGLVSVALTCIAWASRSNNGASTNVLLPAHALIALLFALGLTAAVRELAGLSIRGRGFQAYALGLGVLELMLLAYNPRLTVPYRSDQWADEELAARLASLEGPVFAPNLDGYSRGTGAEQPYFVAVGDLDGQYGGTPTDEGIRWWSDLKQALHERRFKQVVLRDEDCCALRAVVAESGYVDSGALFPPDDQFWLLKTSRTPDVHLYSAPAS